MKVQKTINKFKKRFDKSAFGETVNVIDLTRGDFKENLSTPYGIGSQDLGEEANELLTKLGEDGYSPELLPLGYPSPSELNIRIVVKKTHNG